MWGPVGSWRRLLGGGPTRRKRPGRVCGPSERIRVSVFHPMHQLEGHALVPNPNRLFMGSCRKDLGWRERQYVARFALRRAMDRGCSVGSLCSNSRKKSVEQRERGVTRRKE